MLPASGRLNSLLTRRALLGALGAAAAISTMSERASRLPSGLPQPMIQPREAWAQGLQPTGPLLSEADGDVRFLLIHHSATPNDDPVDQIPARIRSFYSYHTGTKGWPDVAYNFFVDNYGGLWEGRQGSLTSPIQGDATGGSQGFAQLVCFIGDYSAISPSTAALDAAAQLLAWLASKYSIDLHPGAAVSFVSRGSSLWPAGAEVTTDTVAGHRDMSVTTCPGDALYPLVRNELAAAARELAQPMSDTESVSGPISTTPPPAETHPPSDPAETPPAPSSHDATPTPEAPMTPAPEGSHLPTGVAVGAGIVGIGAAAVALARSRRPPNGSEPDPDQPHGQS